MLALSNTRDCGFPSPPHGMLCRMPAWERAKNPVAHSREAKEVQSILCRHLRTSSLYDDSAVNAALTKADLFEEQVIVYQKVYSTARLQTLQPGVFAMTYRSLRKCAWIQDLALLA